MLPTINRFMEESVALNPHHRRCLIDYTECRRDGTKSSHDLTRYTNHSDTAALYVKNKTLSVGNVHHIAFEPSCKEIASPSDDGRHAVEQAERIDFYLKVPPKSQRKHTRVSTLDMVGTQADLFRQISLSNSHDGRDRSVKAAEKSYGSSTRSAKLQNSTHTTETSPYKN